LLSQAFIWEKGEIAREVKGYKKLRAAEKRRLQRHSWSLKKKIVGRAIIVFHQHLAIGIFDFYSGAFS